MTQPPDQPSDSPRPPADSTPSSPPPPPPPAGGTPPPPPPPPGGYPPPGQQPPPPGYGAAPGYGAPGYAAPPPPGYASSDDKTWALVSHFGGAVVAVVTGGVLAWVPALVAYLSKGKESPTVRAHSVAALNFQIIWSVVAFVGYILGTCGAFFVIGALLYLVTAAAVVIQLIFGIIAGLRANEGQLYQYPLSYQLIK